MEDTAPSCGLAHALLQASNTIFNEQSSLAGEPGAWVGLWVWGDAVLQRRGFPRAGGMVCCRWGMPAQGSVLRVLPQGCLSPGLAACIICGLHRVLFRLVLLLPCALVLLQQGWYKALRCLCSPACMQIHMAMARCC
jgi:hypothetical protein